MIGSNPYIKYNPLNGYWNRYYNLYKEDIHAILTKLHTQEDLYSKSTLIYNLLQYELAFNLVTSLWLEYREDNEPDWSYYEEKYELDILYDKLICNDINLEDLLEIFELPYTDIEDLEINGASIETNLVLEELIEENSEEGYILYDDDTYIEDENDIPFIYRNGISSTSVDLFNLPLNNINLLNINSQCQ